jgi:hypothetical protein
MTQEERAELERFDVVKEWLTQIGNKPTTTRHYLGWLAKFCHFAEMTPPQMLKVKSQALKQGQPKSKVESKLILWVGELQKTYSEPTVNLGYTAVRSFVASSGHSIPPKLIKLGLTLDKEMRVPTQTEIQNMIQYAVGLQQKTLVVLMSECSCRPRVFSNLRWGWLEKGWQNKDVAYVKLPKEYRPTTPGSTKFEPAAFIGRHSIEALQKLKEFYEAKGKTITDETRIFPPGETWVRVVVHRTYIRTVRQKIIVESKPDEQTISAKSFRKFVFNAIDAARDISPEWRGMLKGRSLQVEKYYSQENIEALRKIYHEKILPALGTSTITDERVKEQEKRIDQLQSVLKDRLLSDLNECWLQTGMDLQQEEASEDEQKKTVANFEKERSRILAQLKSMGATDNEIAEVEKGFTAKRA